MVSPTNDTLLTGEDPPAVHIDRPFGQSPFLFVGDHAGNAIPAQLQKLGLGDDALHRHIAWDIGIRRLGGRLADAMDATFIHQPLSRLVIDCNRDPVARDSMPAISDAVPIPGNQALDPAAAYRRVAEIHAPYHRAIAAELERRRKAGRDTILVALHSFTPVMNAFERPWHTGVLHHLGNTVFAKALLARLRQENGLVVGDNEPYRMDGIDYTVPHHAYPTMMPYAEIEIRQDLLESDEGVEHWCGILERALVDAAVTSYSLGIGGSEAG